MPGDSRTAFEHEAQARQVLTDAEDDLREYRLEVDEVPTAGSRLDANLMPTGEGTGTDLSYAEVESRPGDDYESTVGGGGGTVGAATGNPYTTKGDGPATNGHSTHSYTHTTEPATTTV